MTQAAVLAQMGNTNQTFRNRIINGAMMIDQRNAGASLTPTTNLTYTLDRWCAVLTAASKYSVQQNAGSVTPPSGYTNYLGVTSLSAYSVGSGDLFQIRHCIEGYNVADLGFGASGASTVTLSFWVRSSLTGTFGGCLNNSAGNRNYLFTYTISSANTWEQKTVTIAGDTTGTWLTTNGSGIEVRFGLGAGSTYSGAAGSWTSSAVYQPTGATSVVGTNGATFYITGVQLEAGTTATPFEMRSYGVELALCQRYYTKSFETNTAPGTATSLGVIPICVYLSGSFTWQLGGTFVVPMRSAPTVSYWDANGNASKVSYLGNGTTTFNNNVALASGGPFNASTSGFTFQSNVSTNGTYFIQYTASAEL